MSVSLAIRVTSVNQVEKKKKAAGLLQVKEGDKASPLNLSFFFCKNEISLRGRSTNSQGRPKGTDLSLVIRVQIVPVPNC